MAEGPEDTKEGIIDMKEDIEEDIKHTKEDTRRRRKSVVQETPQPAPPKSHIWKFEEKKALLEALKRHGFSDTELLAQEVGTRNQNEVEYFINVWSRRTARRDDFADVNISKLFHPPVCSKPPDPGVFPPIALWKKIIFSSMQGKNRRDDYSYIYSELFKHFAEEEPEYDDPDMPNFKEVYKFLSDALNDTAPARMSPLNSLIILHLIDDMGKFICSNDLKEEFEFAREFYGPMKLLPVFKNEDTEISKLMSECNAYGVPTLPIRITHDDDEEVENKKFKSQDVPPEQSTSQVSSVHASLTKDLPSSEASTSGSQASTSEVEPKYESTASEKVLPQAPTTRRKSSQASTLQIESKEASPSYEPQPPASEALPETPTTRSKSRQASASLETPPSVSSVPTTRKKSPRQASSQKKSNQGSSLEPLPPASEEALTQAPTTRRKSRQASTSSRESVPVSTSHETQHSQTSDSISSSDTMEETSFKTEEDEDIWSSMLSINLSVFESISEHLKIKENLNPLMTHIFHHKKEQILIKEYINAYRDPDE